MRRCLIRADASVQMGGGHVVRCAALADALAAQGWQAVFATQPQTLDLMPDLLTRYPGSIATCRGSADDIPRLRQHGGRFEACIIDGYAFSARYEQALAGLADVTIAIDDWPERHHVTDILVDQTLGRTADEYDACVPAGTVRLCGSRYALLRPEFAAQRSNGQARQQPATPARVLISFGLTDPFNATGLALQWLAGTPIRPVIVIGDHAPHRADVVAKLEDFPGAQMEGQVTASRMVELISRSDWVIGAPGISSYERCCLGAPSLLLLLADNQEPNAKALVEAGAAMLLGDIRQPARPEMRARLMQALSDPDLAVKMGRAAAGVCDGQGTARIVAAIEARLRQPAPPPGPAA